MSRILKPPQFPLLRYRSNLFGDMRFSQLKRSPYKKSLLICYLLMLVLLVLVIAISRSQYGMELYRLQPEPTNIIDDVDDFAEDNSSPRNPDAEECTTIHLALVVGGFNSTRNLYVLLKSILFYRTDILYLHLFVDNTSLKILSELFVSWNVHDLKVDFYNMTDYEKEVSWITSQHYSHRYGLMKLVVPPVIYRKHNISKVILMDTDLLILGDIRRLWAQFDNFDKTSDARRNVFGMVENQSDWYLGGSQLSGTKSVWPAIGFGFNSGVVLIDLLECDRQGWTKLWRQTAEKELTSYLSTSLADQDILNAVLRLNPHMVYTLPCSYNIQLNDHTNLDEACFDSKRSFRLIHWNSPNKFMTKNLKASQFKDWYLTFMNWDAKLLQRHVCRNQTTIKQPEIDSSGLEAICKEIQPRPHEKLRTFLYFLEFELEPTDYDVTLVVHLSLDRLRVFDQLASHWPGPISAAIYLSELETNLLLTSIQDSSNLYPARKNIGYHLVFRDNGFNYPINRLRNIALNNAITPYVFLSDVDFLPSTNLYGYLKDTIENMVKGGERDPLSKRGLVVPAFENLQYKFDFPASKADLLTQLNLGSVSIFRDQIWPRGQAPTNYAKWKASTKLYKAEWKPEYEPFIVTSRNVSRFDERFVGFGWNKVENFMKLAASGYEFLVLPEAFVIHKFHSASYDIMKHRESLRYRTCINQLRRLFLIELKMQYPKFFERISATTITADSAANELEP